jgi:hypothetical protein
MQKPLPPVPPVGPAVGGAPGLPISAVPTGPLPSQPPGAQNPPPPQQQAIPDRTRPYRGWYPRWWLLAALLCALLIGLVQVLQVPLCKNDFAASNFCTFTTWTDWRQIVVIASSWVLMGLFWLITFLTGVGPIEVKRSRDDLPRFIRWISEFKAVGNLFPIYAFFALAAFITMYWLNTVPTLTFVLCSIVLFVANCFFFYKQDPLSRRRYLVGYAVLALIGIAVMWRVNRFQLTLLTGEVVIVLVGLWALVSWLRGSWNTPASAPQMTPAQRLALANEQALEPDEVFRALVGSLWHRNRP